MNVIFCIEGMEENGSEGLDEFIASEKAHELFKDVDAICISDNYWLGTKKPVLTYGLRGCSYYAITVEGPNTDLHSGVFGGTVCEPMTDLTQLLASLVKPAKDAYKIQVPGVAEMVAPVTDAERRVYEPIDYNLTDLADSLGGRDCSLHATKADTLMARWRMPALSIHGIEGAFAQPGAKTVIPAKVSAKISIRTVPNIAPSRLNELVTEYVHNQFGQLGTKSSVKVDVVHEGNWWVSDPNNWSFEAAKQATRAVWGVDPDLTREGGSIPVTLTFEKELQKPVLLLPMGRGDDGAHSTMEKLDKQNYIQGTKTLASYLYFAAKAKTDTN